MMKLNNLVNKGLSLLLSIAMVLAFTQVQAQDEAAKNFEKYQDQLYKIAEYQIEYPDLVFDYNYDMDGDLESVTITGVDDADAKDQLRVWLMELHETSDLLLYGKDENNIYYKTEERARFKDGRTELYRELRGNLQYPEIALDRGIEGVVQLKFVVDRWGNVENVQAHEEMDIPDWIAKEMIKEAKQAFMEIDHDWIPGEIDNTEVPQWVILPVHFKVEMPRDLQIIM